MAPTRRTTVPATLALTLVLGFLPAISNSHSPSTSLKDSTNPAGSCASFDGYGYQYCGRHWRLSELPIKFRLNTDGAPGNIGASQFLQAAQQAAAAWNNASTVSGTRRDRGSCAATDKLICIESTGTTGTADPEDGVNVIRWDSLGQGAILGYAQLWPSQGQRIEDVDIVLNNDWNWYWLTPTDAATGTADGAVAFFCSSCISPDVDLQSILTHEMGHALGLGHPHVPTSSDPRTDTYWPENSQDALNYNQVMYPVYYANNATQRVLQWGDVAGLQAVTADSSSDR
ncbi:MAG: matrixin family metalloprotease [Actinomycetota bacterium]